MEAEKSQNRASAISFFPVLLVALLASGVARAQPAPGPDALTSDEAVALAQSNNADLRSLEAENEAAKARLVGASLPFPFNPTLTVTAGPRSSPLGRSRDDSFQLMQPIEMGGRRHARIEAATAGLDAAEARLRARRAEIAALVREAFGRALAARQRARLAAEAQTIAQDGLAAARERFEAGAAALLEVNTARVEAGRLARERAEAERRQAETQGDLNLLLGVDAERVPSLEGELRAQDGGELDERLLTELALANRAEITASRRALDSAIAQARLTEREKLPVPKVGLSFTREEESDTEIVQGLLSFDLPIFNRHQEARGVAAARVGQLEKEMEATRRRIRQEVATAVARLRAARSAADSFAGEVVKALEENMELGTESYRAGKIDFLQLLLVRRQTLEARNEHIDVLEELAVAAAQLERAVGGGR